MRLFRIVVPFFTILAVIACSPGNRPAVSAQQPDTAVAAEVDRVPSYSVPLVTVAVHTPYMTRGTGPVEVGSPGDAALPSHGHVTSVQNGQDGAHVLVVTNDQHAELRPVRIRRTRGTARIIESGLAPTEVVVTNGQLRLVAGSRVTIKSDVQKAGP